MRSQLSFEPPHPFTRNSGWDAVQESLGFSPFELVFGHSVRRPLKVLQEAWLEDLAQYNRLEYISMHMLMHMYMH